MKARKEKEMHPSPETIVEAMTELLSRCIGNGMNPPLTVELIGTNDAIAAMRYVWDETRTGLQATGGEASLKVLNGLEAPVKVRISDLNMTGEWGKWTIIEAVEH